MNVKIIGTGYSVPQKIVTNKDLEKIVDTTDEWIIKNTGIRERRICNRNENSSYLGGLAALQAIKSSGLNKEDIDMLIVATTTPDKLSPSTACIIKDELGLINTIAFDISAVCSGFLFGMSVAEQYISSGTYNNILVIGVDIFSKITDWKRRDCVFFGDGAGAAILSRSEEMGFRGFMLYSDSFDRIGFNCERNKKFVMNTRSVYDTAVRVLPIAINGVLNKVGMTINDIDYIIPHQPSVRILTEVAKRINIPIEKVMMNMDKYANTVAGTIPILLHETWNKFKKGDILLFAAIGSGWTYGASIYEV
jgi:3-oxoacyl-[acyl-carrier-protein] synthase III